MLFLCTCAKMQIAAGDCARRPNVPGYILKAVFPTFSKDLHNNAETFGGSFQSESVLRFRRIFFDMFFDRGKALGADIVLNAACVVECCLFADT